MEARFFCSNCGKAITKSLPAKAKMQPVFIGMQVAEHAVIMIKRKLKAEAFFNARKKFKQGLPQFLRKGLLRLRQRFNIRIHLA